MLALGLVTLASAAVALGARHERRASAPTLLEPGSRTTVTSRATTVAPTSSPGTGFFTTAPHTTAPHTTAPPTATPQPTISTGTLPVAPGAPSTVTKTTPAPAKTRTAARPPARSVGSWPSGISGWTDILESLPESPTGRAEALASAHRAARAGLTQVGVLRSADYSTLRAGYWVVYAGVFTNRAAAESALATASTHGFSGPYPARISR